MRTWSALCETNSRDTLFRIGAVAALTGSGTPLDVPPPAPATGLKTVTDKVVGVAISDAKIVAVSCKAFLKTVGRLLPFTSTVELVRNPLPLTVRLNDGPPVVTEAGERLVTTGGVSWAAAGLMYKTPRELSKNAERISQVFNIGKTNEPRKRSYEGCDLSYSDGVNESTITSVSNHVKMYPAIQSNPFVGRRCQVPVLVRAQSSGQKIAPASGKAMCSALTSTDFTKAGVPVSRLRQANLDDDRSAYCIYDSQAGRVELDIFYPAGDTPAEAQNAARAAQSAIGGKFEPVSVAGADEATTNAGSPQGTDSASIVVRRGATVFNASIPHGAQARQQLVTLSETVVSRLKK